MQHYSITESPSDFNDIYEDTPVSVLSHKVQNLREIRRKKKIEFKSILEKDERNGRDTSIRCVLYFYL